MDPIVRGASAWSLGQHATWREASNALQRRLEIEGDPDVVVEIQTALG